MADVIVPTHCFFCKRTFTQKERVFLIRCDGEERYFCDKHPNALKMAKVQQVNK